MICLMKAYISSLIILMAVGVACKPNQEPGTSETLVSGAQREQDFDWVSFKTTLRDGQSCFNFSNDQRIIVTREGNQLVARRPQDHSQNQLDNSSLDSIPKCRGDSEEGAIVDAFIRAVQINRGTDVAHCAVVMIGGIPQAMASGSETAMNRYAAYHNSQTHAGGSRAGMAVCTVQKNDYLKP